MPVHLDLVEPDAKSQVTFSYAAGRPLCPRLRDGPSRAGSLQPWRQSSTKPSMVSMNSASCSVRLMVQ